MGNYGWNERDSKVEPRHFIGGDKPAAVYEIGTYQVTVSCGSPESAPEVTYRNSRYQSADPRQTFPNMGVKDGEIRLPVTDLVGEILTRLEPVELAQALWADDAVRAAFMDCLVTRYNEQGIGDADRRKFLHDVKEAVHDKAVDGLRKKIGSLEYAVSKRAFFYHEINTVNDRLREVEVMLRGRFDVSDIELPRLRHEDNDPDFRIGGKHWNDARDDWRKTLLAMFPALQETPDTVLLTEGE